MLRSPNWTLSLQVTEVKSRQLCPQGKLPAASSVSTRIHSCGTPKAVLFPQNGTSIPS